MSAILESAGVTVSRRFDINSEPVNYYAIDPTIRGCYRYPGGEWLYDGQTDTPVQKCLTLTELHHAILAYLTEGL